MAIGTRKVICIVPAAGCGLRFGGPVRKQYLEINKRPIIDHTLSNLKRIEWLDEICMMVPEIDLVSARERYADIRVAAGGETRQGSVYRGLQTYRKALLETDFVMIHDGVRPFFPIDSKPIIEAHIRDGHSFVVAVPVTDTIKEVGPENAVSRTIERRFLRQIQTPQGASFGTLFRAHERAVEESWEVTDDAALLERCGEKVLVIEGSRDNIKITTPLDLEFAKVIYERYQRENWSRV